MQTTVGEFLFTRLRQAGLTAEDPNRIQGCKSPGMVSA